MNLQECEAHIDGPFIARIYPQVITGIIRGIRAKDGLVKVQEFYKNGYRLKPGFNYWHPVHLEIPQWWIAKHGEVSK